jgi:hypothetical protein
LANTAEYPYGRQVIRIITARQIVGARRHAGLLDCLLDAVADTVIEIPCLGGLPPAQVGVHNVIDEMRGIVTIHLGAL